MKPRIRMGLIVGVIGLVLNICVSGFIGLCGPIFALLAGGAAGFFAAQQERLPTKGDGARAGATSGGIAGALIILGQIIGGMGALLFLQTSGVPTVLGSAPSVSGDPTTQIAYYASGLGTAVCFGVIGALLAAGAGAGAGYLATQDQPPASSTAM